MRSFIFDILLYNDDGGVVQAVGGMVDFDHRLNFIGPLITLALDGNFLHHLY